MQNLLRCKRNLGFWAHFDWVIGGEIGCLYFKVCDQENDLPGGPAFVRSSSGVRPYELPSWNWCDCYAGYCMVSQPATAPIKSSVELASEWPVVSRRRVSGEEV